MQGITSGPKSHVYKVVKEYTEGIYTRQENESPQQTNPSAQTSCLGFSTNTPVVFHLRCGQSGHPGHGELVFYDGKDLV